MTPTLLIILFVLCVFVCSLSVLLGAWIAYSASQGKSPVPPLRFKKKPAPSEVEEPAKRLKL